MTNGKFYVTIVLLSAVVSGILSQNAPNNIPQPVPNQIGDGPSPSPSPSPTPAPPECKTTSSKPSASADKQKFKIVKKGDNQTEDKVCLLAEFNVVVLVNGTSQQYLDFGKGTMNPSQSTCDYQSKKANLVVDYACGSIQIAVDGNQTVSVESIHGQFKIGNDTLDYAINGPLFKTTKPGYYFRCNSEQKVPLTIVPTDATLKDALLMSNLGLEAFPNKNQDSFSSPPEVCEADTKPVSDLVPIAVGACLAALVVIVLIAYFVGRRRWSERSTYESV